MTFLSVSHFFTRVNSDCSRFNSYCRAEKNSELSKTSKMNLLEKIFKIFKNTIFATTFILDVGFNSNTSKMKLLEKTVKIFIIFVLEISRNLTCSNFFCKVTGSKALISMKQDSTRE